MQRKAGTLTALEARILDASLEFAASGDGEFHGFLLAKRMKEREGALFRTAYGPLYKALDRLAQNGLLASRWEEPAVAAEERRPRRCLYHVTGAGRAALEAHERRTDGSAVEGEAPA